MADDGVHGRRPVDRALAGHLEGRVRRIHFVGIGGVGMSGIAQILVNLGYEVSGSDLKATELTRRLAAAGARVHAGHKASHIRGAEVVVVSSAVSPANPEVAAARRAGVPVVPRGEMLAELARLKKTVTVAGTHGKTTTTAMTAMALRGAGADPTVIVGGQVADLGSNARVGLGEFLVAEADESDGSFMRLVPLAAVVTNIDDDHLDHYGSMAELKKAFLTHLHGLPFYGAAVLCVDDPGVRSILPRVDRRVITYGLKPGAQWRGKVLDGRRVDVFHKGKRAGTLTLRLWGRHNAQNSLAAVAVSDFLGLSVPKAMAGLSAFRGVGRRMELLGEGAGISFLDDYGHHQTEVAATLEAVRGAYPGRRLVVVFQPHRYSRTKALHRAFGPALRRADLVFVMDIYPAGEKPIPGVGPRLILDSLKRARAFTRPLDLIRELRPGDVVLTLGAGDVWKVGADLMRRAQSSTLTLV